MIDLTFGLSAIGMCIVALLIAGWGFDKIGKKWFNVAQSTKRIIGVIGLLWALGIALTSGWFAVAPPTTTQTGVIPADYAVTVTTNSSSVTIDTNAKIITVLLDTNGTTAFDSGSQNANATFQITRVDAGTSDSAMVMDVASVGTWVDVNGYNRYVLQKYGTGEYYADWFSGGSSAVNDKISVVIDRSTTSIGSAGLQMVADITSWLTESVGDSHAVTITLTDVASGFSQTWTVNFTLVNAS